MRILRSLKPLGGPILVSLALALALVPSATAYEVPSKLNEVAHVYSLGVGEVRCPSRAEWDQDWASSFGWAYTNVRDDHTVLSPVVCEGALGVGSADVPLWQQALGSLVLTHEAFHLRHWRFRRNEGKVECQALVNFRDAAQRLGATPEQAEDLYPYALALHDYKVRLFPQYRDPKCVIPPWAPPTTTGPTDEGFRTIEIWESEPSWQHFQAKRLAPAIAALGGPARPEPTFRGLRATHVVVGTAIVEKEAL